MALIHKGRDHGIGERVKTVAHGIGMIKAGEVARVEMLDWPDDIF